MVTERRVRILYTGLGVALAIILVLVRDTPIRPSLSTSLWFEILLWIVIAAFLLEPFFSGAPSAIINSASVIFIALGAGFQGPSALWIMLVAASASAVVLLIIDYALKNPDVPDDAPAQRIARASRQIGLAVGSWRFSLMAVLALALVAFNRPFADPWVVSLVVVLYVLGVSRLQPHTLIALMRGRQEPGVRLAAARVLPPSELLVTGAGLDELEPGHLLRVRGSGRVVDAIALAPTYIQGKRALRLFAPGLRRVLHTDEVHALGLEIGIPADMDSPFRSYRDELRHEEVEAIGSVADGSSMLELAVELFPDRTVNLGQLLWTLPGDRKTYWQVVDARVARSSWGGDTRRTVVAHGVQLGHWDEASFAFQPDVASPAHTDLVFAGPAAGPASGITPEGHHVIGTVPNSQFPVAVNLRDFTLHHAAILGTTGTGKTHLSFDLAETMAGAGVKVICVDTTGQYIRRFPTPGYRHINLAAVEAFLADAANLAVYTPDPETHTIRDGKALAQTLFNWAKSQPERDPADLARCVVIFEEAQNYVPEQFVVDDWNLKVTAQDTSRIIMESRKFGLGFVLVSQRTAMVTKSALSQCNTVIAFQAVDQTGLDYLEGLCGATLAHGIPSLPTQTAISMGRGMASARPIIVRVNDASIVIH